MRLFFDGLVIKVVDESGNGFYIAQATIVESNHATNQQKRKLLEAALAKLTPEEIRDILD
jgi:hypothetical protein